MSTFDLAQKIRVINKSSNIDALYGHYDSVEDACLAIAEVLRSGGRTVGIKQNDGKILEYWWGNDNDLSDAGLVPKSTGASNGGTYFKEITKDGDFTATKIAVGTNTGKFEFKIVGEETLEWLIGIDEYVYNLDYNGEWKFLADALGSGVERRIDAVSYGNDGELHYWKGTETGQAAYPNIPETHILKTFVTLTEEGVAFDDTSYFTKTSEKWWGNIFVPAVANSQLFISGTIRNIWISNENTPLIINNIHEYTTFYPPVWNGMIVRIWNRNTTGDITVKHGVGVTGRPIIFPNNQDYILKPGEIITLSKVNYTNDYRLISSNMAVGSGGSSSAVLFTVQELTLEQQEQARDNIGAIVVNWGLKEW